MMQYDFGSSGSTLTGVIAGLETKDNMQSYNMQQQQQDSFLKSTLSNSNMMTTTNDMWHLSPSSRSSYFSSSSFDFNTSSDPSHSHQQYRSTINSNFDFQPLPDISSSYLIDPYAHMFTGNNYSIDPYTIQTSYNPISMDYSSSSSHTPMTTDSYHPSLHSMYAAVPPPASSYLPPSSLDIQTDYQSTPSQWESSGPVKVRNYDVTSVSNCANNSSKQPCLVCHDESSGYHFGAYTCESCKAFYRRVTKDPQVEIKHSCEVPLPHITKSNRKDCRACRKAKCDRVGMTAMPKDRISRITTNKIISKSSFIPPITDLLEQLGRDLTYDQFASSSSLNTILRTLDLPPLTSIDFDCHSLYMNAIRIWQNQTIASSNDLFAVLLFLFRALIIVNDDNDEEKYHNQIKFDKLVHILQQEITRITGTNHRAACRFKALFMKSYVALAQYPNSTTNHVFSQSQQFIHYHPYQLYGQ